MYQVNFLPWRQRRDRRRGCFWLGALLLQVTLLLLALFLVAGQLRHQQAQRQARLTMLGEELAALTLLAHQQQQERAQRALHSARAERQARVDELDAARLQRVLTAVSSSIEGPTPRPSIPLPTAVFVRCSLRSIQRS